MSAKENCGIENLSFQEKVDCVKQKLNDYKKYPYQIRRIFPEEQKLLVWFFEELMNENRKMYEEITMLKAQINMLGVINNE